MNTYALSALLASIFTISIGIFVYSRNTRSRVFVLFLCINICVSIWTLGTFFLASNISLKTAVFFNKLSYFFGAFIPAFFTDFIFEIIGYHPKRWFYWGLYATATFFSIMSLTDLFYLQLVNRLPSYYYLPLPRPFYTVFVLYFFGVLIYVYYRLFLSYLQSVGNRKKQLFYLIVASFIGFCGTLDFFLTVYDFKFKLPFPHDYPIIAYTLIFAYAILRHRLMDVEVVIKRSFVFASLFATVVIIYSVPLFIFQNIFQQTLRYSQWLSVAITITAMMLGYERLKKFLIEITDKFLFQKKYEYRKALWELGKETSRLMKVTTFAKILNRNVIRIVKLSGSSVAVLDRKSNEYVILAASRSHRINLGRSLKKENPLIYELDKRDYLVTEEIEKTLKNQNLNKDESEHLCQVLTLLKNFKTELCVPSKFEKEIVGFMLFGEKLSGDAYSEEDLDLFITLSRQIALAINNSYLYEQSLEKERELAKKELEKQTERIRRLASLGELAAGLAHEIRNPMTVLRSRAEDLKNELDNKKYLTEFAELTVKHIDRILDIVKNMLRFAREQEKIHLSRVNINEVLKDTLLLVEGRKKIRGVQIISNLEAHQLITGDPNALQQAFLNIFMNSFDFMPEGGTLTVKSEDKDNYVLVEIIDTGTGIPPDKIDHIFDPFFTTRAEGTGLGLSITYRIIEDHGGRISVSSELQKGTTFLIWLPAEKE